MTEKKENISCDYCGKNSPKYASWFLVTQSEDIGFRMFEKTSDRSHIEGRHITRRNNLDFCSQECCTRYLYSEVQTFVAELAAPKNPNNATTLL